RTALKRELTDDIHAHYEEREAEVGEENMRELERQIVLSVLDRKWREHLYEMDYLKEGIGLRAMAQRDPLVEYKDEGYRMFQAMNDNIMSETVRYLFKFELPSERAARLETEAQVTGPVTVAGNAAAGMAGPGVAIHASGAGSAEQVSASQQALRAAQEQQRELLAEKQRALQAAVGEGAAGASGQRVTAESLGIKQPKRQQNVSYSSAAKDGSGETETTGSRGAARGGRGGAGGSGGGNRAQRRAAAKQNKKRRR
ncbi:preprotein translocase subunit SecA, partial [Actinotignum sanguinis]|nr:preprotein translocase subunit SecA [Actinotignum sanguinis]